MDQVAERSPQRQEVDRLQQRLRGEQSPGDEGRLVEVDGLVVEDTDELERALVGQPRNWPLKAEVLKWLSGLLDAGGTPQGGLPCLDGTAAESGAEGLRGLGKNPPGPRG